MKVRIGMAFLIGVLGLALVAPSGWTGDKKKDKDKVKPAPGKEVVVNGELIDADVKDKVLTGSYCKTYTFKMTEGKMYQIDLMSMAFDSYLRLETAQGVQVAVDDDSGGNLNARILYRAPKTDEYQIFATSLGAGSTGKFTLIAKEVTGQGGVADGKPIELKNEQGKATFDGNLAANDARYNNKPHKLLVFPMQEGKTYQIDMKSKAIDSYLYLEDPEGNVLAKDDDSGGFPDARITYKAAKSGKHRIIATCFGGQNAGDFTVTVVQTDPDPAQEEKKK